MYTIDTVHEVLLAQQLVSSSSFMAGDYEATSVTRRNRNIQVTTLDEGSYLIKQALDSAADNAKTLRTEILFYRYLIESKSDFLRYTAAPRLTDSDARVLVLDLLKDAKPLWQHYRSLGADHLPFGAIGELGKLLAAFHRTFSLAQDNPPPAFLTRDLPFGLRVNRPKPEITGYVRQGGLQYLRRLQADLDVMQQWEMTVSMWSHDAIIHGDVKLDNILVLGVADDDDADSPVDIRLIDWELVQIGDRAWDVAGVLQDFVFWWAISMPDGRSPTEMVQEAAFPIGKLKPGMRCFWDSYLENLPMPEPDRMAFLEKTVRLSGIRILQTAYEIASKFETLPPIAEVLMGMGKSILRKPDAAASELFGLKTGVVA